MATEEDGSLEQQEKFERWALKYVMPEVNLGIEQDGLLFKLLSNEITTEEFEAGMKETRDKYLEAIS